MWTVDLISSQALCYKQRHLSFTLRIRRNLLSVYKPSHLATILWQKHCINTSWTKSTKLRDYIFSISVPLPRGKCWKITLVSCVAFFFFNVCRSPFAWRNNMEEVRNIWLHLYLQGIMGYNAAFILLGVFVLFLSPHLLVCL